MIKHFISKSLEVMPLLQQKTTIIFFYLDNFFHKVYLETTYSSKYKWFVDF